MVLKKGKRVGGRRVIDKVWCGFQADLDATRRKPPTPRAAIGTPRQHLRRSSDALELSSHRACRDDGVQQEGEVLSATSASSVVRASPVVRPSVRPQMKSLPCFPEQITLAPPLPAMI